MCPYVPGALRSGSIYFAAGELEVNAQELVEATQATIRKFCGMRCVDVPSALIILFPHTERLDNLLHIHREMKVACVRKHLMVGVLSPQSEAWSIHSRDFFPLRTPAPTLVVRDMALFDIEFLIDGPYNTHQRIAFLEAYLQRFDSGRHSDRVEVYRARELLRRYERIQYGWYTASTVGLAALAWVGWRRYISIKER